MLQHDAGRVALNIADHFALRIICGELDCGAPLREMALTREYQVGLSSVREALLVLQRRYLVDIFPYPSVQFRVLTVQNIQDLYDSSTELYILLGALLAQSWHTERQLLVLLKLRRAMQSNIEGFTRQCFSIIAVAVLAVQNLYLEEVLVHMIPAGRGTYYLPFQQRGAQMERFLRIFVQLMLAVQ